jgi:hypothetical protein
MPPHSRLRLLVEDDLITAHDKECMATCTRQSRPSQLLYFRPYGLTHSLVVYSPDAEESHCEWHQEAAFEPLSRVIRFVYTEERISQPRTRPGCRQSHSWEL